MLKTQLLSAFCLLAGACSTASIESPGAGGSAGGTSGAPSSASAENGGEVGGAGIKAGGAGAESGSSGGSSSGAGTGVGGTSGAIGGGGSGSGAGGSNSFAPGTLCNASGSELQAPAKIKHLIVILFENENKSAVIGADKAPYISSLAARCAVATAYQDDVFTDNLVSLPHYLALTSGSNCNTGLGGTGTDCITNDADATAKVLSTNSIFSQVQSWKAYQEGMPSACAKSSGGRYATKHNPAAYYALLPGCAAHNLSIPALTCSPSLKNTPCTSAPGNAFMTALANDELAEFTFVSPTLDNDMHDGTITQADNWVATYLPLISASKAYLRGEVVVQLLWDEQTTSEFGGPTPNVFISPYITAGKTSSVPINHFSVLRSWEKALGISAYLGCAGGSPPGGVGMCPANSTADVRAALGW